VSRPASSGRLARLVVALGAIRFACTDRQRGVPIHKVSRPPRRHQLVPRSAPDRSGRAAAPTSLRRAPAQTCRANQGARGKRAGATAPALAARVRRARRASRWSSEVSGDAAASATHSGGQLLLLPVIWLVAERQQARTADSKCEWHTQQVSVFAVVLVLVPRCARERSGSPLEDTLSQRELPHSRHTGTLQLLVLQHMYVPCRSSFSLPSRGVLEDVSQSQI
jgi:hypothetical protein